MAIVDQDYKEKFGRIDGTRKRVKAAAENEGFEVDVLNIGESNFEDVKDFKSSYRVFKHLIKTNYDYVYVAGSYLPENLFPLFSKVASFDLIYDTHCLGIHKLQPGWKNIFKKILTFPFLNTSHIRCLSSWEGEKYKEERMLLSSSVNIIPYGVNTDYFEDVDTSLSSKQTFSLSNARRFKNIEVQIEAAEKVSEKYPNFRHNIIGGWKEDEYREEIEELISEKGLSDKVKIHGYVEREKIKSIISECSIFVHTSRFETEGLAIYEAMATGAIPCISDVPVHNQNFERFKHPQGDAEALAEDIETIFEGDREENEEISEEMRELAKDFSYEKEIERLKEFFKRIK